MLSGGSDFDDEQPPIHEQRFAVVGEQLEGAIEIGIVGARSFEVDLDRGSEDSHWRQLLREVPKQFDTCELTALLAELEQFAGDLLAGHAVSKASFLLKPDNGDKQRARDLGHG
jgi:hypothetical protein